MPIQPFICLVLATIALSSPVPSKNKVLYDQRQEGDWNLHASLKNFVILVVPSQSSTANAPSVLDFLLKSIPMKGALMKKMQQQTRRRIPGEEPVNFIESKTAPYHVDISKSKDHLAKLHPEVVRAEEIVIANSPAVALIKDDLPHSRTARAFVLAVPEEYPKKKDGKRKKEAPKSVLKLLGAENEQCGPGLARDEEGICRIVKD